MPGLAHFQAVLQLHWPRIRDRLLAPVSMGIAARLACAFLLVAILAAAANFIVGNGGSIAHSVAETQQPAPPASRTTAPTGATPAMPAPADARPLLLAIDRFEHALQARVAAASPDALSEFRAAGRTLEQAAADFHSAAATDEPAATAVEAYRATALAYLRSSDARHAAAAEYLNRLEAINQRLTAAIDSAWKIFGRVLARQNQLQLHAELENIRRQFAAIDSTQSHDAASLARITAGEAAFADTLNGNEASFVRANGADWLGEIRTDFARLIALRAAIIDLDGQQRLGARKVADARAHAVQSVPAQVAIPAALPDATARSRDSSAAPAQPVVMTTATTTATQPDDLRRRRLIAWITAGVLAALLAISLLTVRSIVRPVRQMLEATRKLAAGSTAEPIASGGITELDTLAGAFNQMATQLATAREMTHLYQHQLEHKVAQRTRQLQHLAEHDPLTMLPNRRQLFVLLNRFIERAAANQRCVGVYFIDIDNFKNLNDSMGHDFGDRVLVSIAVRLKEAATRFGFAARLGGDEFTVVHEDADSAAAVAAAGLTLVAAFERPLSVNGREVTVSVSVGASVYPVHETRAENLLIAADAALFRAKALGRSQLAVYTPELLEAATRKFTTEQGLRRAIERGEFELFFQPEVDTNSWEVNLVEALIRWRLPDGRHASPSEFLAVAEESGLIVEVGDWVLESAIETAAGWHHGEWPDVRIAINVSARQLLSGSFVDRVRSLLEEYALPARCIEIELTESVLQTGPAVIESLRQLRALGMAIALDDFGTGYSSLSSLEQLPLTRIKLDQSLIAGIDTNPRALAIAEAIILLCARLGLAVTAEGIERTEQLRHLTGKGSLCLQGYLISRPVPRDTVLELRRRIPHIMQNLLLSMPAGTARVPDLAAGDPGLQHGDVPDLRRWHAH